MCSDSRTAKAARGVGGGGRVVWTPELACTDWNPLKPKVVKEKYYAAGVGPVLEIVKLGGAGRVELIRSSLIGRGRQRNTVRIQPRGARERARPPSEYARVSVVWDF